MKKKSVKKSDELRPLMTRLPERLRARLARDAKRNERSLNAEINYRLEKSLSYEAAFSGERMRAIAIEISTAFESAGAGEAYNRGLEGDWLDDPDCWRVASFAVLKMLMLRNPEPTLDPDRMLMQCEALKMAVVRHILNRNSESRTK